MKTLLSSVVLIYYGIDTFNPKWERGFLESMLLADMWYGLFCSRVRKTRAGHLNFRRKVIENDEITENPKNYANWSGFFVFFIGLLAIECIHILKRCFAGMSGDVLEPKPWKKHTNTILVVCCIAASTKGPFYYLHGLTSIPHSKN